MAVRLVPGLLLIMAADATTVAADYTQEVRRDNPIAWWRFQDTAFADGAATRDEMGAHSGIYRGGVTLEAGLSGTGGKAAKFDGRGAYVEIPHHADFAQNTLSVECWFRSTQAWTQANWPASATLLSKGTEGAGSSDWVLLGGAAEGRQGCVIARPGPKGGPDVVAASPGSLNDDQWHHVVWTRSAAGVNQLFVDGAKVAEIRDSGAAITNERPIQIGGDPWLGGKSFAGTLAEVAIYGRSLDAARVAAHFAAVPLLARKPRQVLPEARPSLPVTMPARPDGFTPLFDGKSLDGWEGDLKVFRVEDGAIAGGSLRESVRDSVYLATTREFADFELHVKFKAVPTQGDEANGGIQFRSRRLPQGTQVSGYQADLGVFKNFPPGIFSGCLFDNARRDRILAGDPQANEPIVRKGDWNQYVIRAEGRHIRLWLNGQQTVDYTEQDVKIPQAGIIALQAHSGPPQELWYKDIVIKDLGRRAEGAATFTPTAAETSAGWNKHDKNPVLGGALGTCFDISVLQVGDTYRMYFSWRPKKSVALTESRDGVTWSEPLIVLGPEKATGWEDDMNRPVVVQRDDGYHMWYTGQAKGKSWIGYATSTDGKSWKRTSDKPVLDADAPWEKVAVMCPHVIWDAQAKRYQMWYSGGEQYEPDAIGYATSPDGLTWTKHTANPVFAADPKSPWEQHKVTACQVERHGGWYLMFYIGFFDLHRAQIGIARSRDGIGGWERHPANPIISPGLNQWDHDACYKPYAIFDGEKWLLWYNGRRGGVEQIGLATHEGEDLGFPMVQQP